MQIIAYELRAEFEDTFAGGVLAVGDGDFHVRDQLERGGGAIVVQSNDQRLVDLLDAYPALKRAKAPADARPISPYERQTAEAIHHAAELRGVKGAGRASRDAIQIVLDAHDRALAANPADVDGVAETPQQLADLVLEGDTDAIAAALQIVAPPAGVEVPDVDAAGETDASRLDHDDVISDVGGFSTDQLVAVLGGSTIEGRDDADVLGRVEVPAAIAELRERAASGDEEAGRALDGALDESTDETPEV